MTSLQPDPDRVYAIYAYRVDYQVHKNRKKAGNACRVSSRFTASSPQYLWGKLEAYCRKN
jgi:hypothetical protein